MSPTAAPHEETRTRTQYRDTHHRENTRVPLKVGTCTCLSDDPATARDPNVPLTLTGVNQKQEILRHQVRLPPTFWSQGQYAGPYPQPSVSYRGCVGTRLSLSLRVSRGTVGVVSGLVFRTETDTQEVNALRHECRTDKLTSLSLTYLPTEDPRKETENSRGPTTRLRIRSGSELTESIGPTRTTCRKRRGSRDGPGGPGGGPGRTDPSLLTHNDPFLGRPSVPVPRRTTTVRSFGSGSSLSPPPSPVPTPILETEPTRSNRRDVTGRTGT